MPQTKTPSKASQAVALRDAGTRRPFGSIVHTELVSRNPELSRAFLEGVFGWSFEEMDTPNGTYRLASATEGPEAALRSAQPGEPKYSTSYVRVENLAEAESLIEEHGGEIVLPRTHVPGRGWYLWFEVPGGPVLAIWQDETEN